MNRQHQISQIEFNSFMSDFISKSNRHLNIFFAELVL
jgi:hypothetical protein